jgi:hypothetical protein
LTKLNECTELKKKGREVKGGKEKYIFVATFILR